MRTAHPADFLRRATNVASYYGFAPLTNIVASRTRTPVEEAKGVDRRAFDNAAGEHLDVVRSLLEHGAASPEAPALFYHGSPRKTRTVFGLGVAGTSQSIAEALVIRTAFTILEDAGVKQATLRVNSIGDRDSSARFVRELQNYFRKNIADLPSACRETLKRDILAAFEYLHRKEHELRNTAPRGMEFLSEANRRHLMEILEYLETAGIPYEIDDGLVGHRECYSQTVFEIRGVWGDGPVTLARGGRFDEAPKRLYKTSLPSVGLVFRLDGESEAPARAVVRRAKVFFIQVGFSAKLKSLPIIETLRRSRIPIHQSVCHDKLGSQLTRAAELGVPYVVIMGQKEAIDGTVIVRHLGTRAQDTIPVASLSLYLKDRVA